MQNHMEYVFNIKLPSYTSKEVIEWFEYMHEKNTLVQELIALVHERLITGEISIDRSELCNKISLQSNIDNNNLTKNLSNWKAANNELFKEEKNKKKKMLSV